MRQLDSVRGAVAHVLTLALATTLPSAGAPAATTRTLSMALAPAASPARPAFHAAPVLLNEPQDTDRTDPSMSAALAPHHVTVRPELTQLSTRRLTRDVMVQMLETGRVPDGAYARGTEADPMASTSGVTVYTPAQIRAAYGLPSLPSLTSSVTAGQAAQLGAGQTIYLIDSNDDPNSAAELAAFDSKFGLPGCSVAPIEPAASLPLPTASLTGCVFSVVYATANGAVSATAPAYNSAWATEIALDVQWAHATAPYARIILIEAPDAGSTSLAAAVQLANSMGPGVVSMSFGAPEGSWTSYYDASFAASNMTYLAAAGDAGSDVEWPAVSSHVVAVAGTSLSYSGAGARAESVWSGTGGGVSAYVAAPAYQSLAVPGLNAPTHRQVSDVAFNANPYTGQYLAVISPGSTSVGWLSIGGTSLATPQWAGIIAMANAVRAQSAQTPIGPAQALLYGFATQQASYASNFLDVTTGADGSCSTCNAGVGYDLPSGLGTPNVASLLPALTGTQAAAAPVVSSATVTGNVGTPLAFTISAKDIHALTYSLSRAPSGMTVSTVGVVSWASPVAGSYPVTLIAHDATTGLSGQGICTVTIAPAKAPVVTGTHVSWTAGKAGSLATDVPWSDPLAFSLSGAPAGMSIANGTGLITWNSPVVGTYSVTVTAKDTKTGLSGSGIYTFTVSPSGPAVQTVAFSGVAGKVFSGSIGITDNASTSLSITISGIPSGMSVSASGNVLTLKWVSPVTGNYSLHVTVVDAKNLAGAATIPVTITAH